MSDIVSIMEKQRKFYSTGETLPIRYRKEKLRALLASIEKHEAEILAALHEDLNKSSFEFLVIWSLIMPLNVLVQAHHSQQSNKSLI